MEVHNMSYSRQFTNPYPNGWQDYPDETTPISANALNAHTQALKGIDDYLYAKTVLDKDNVSISNPQDGQFLVYDGTTSKFKNTTIQNAEEVNF